MPRWSKANPPPNAFRPGQSGNPAGRKPRIDDIHALARPHAAEAIATLVRMLRDPVQCIAAAKELLDRGFGKPPVAVTATVDATLIVGGVDAPRRPGDETYAAWLARAQAELAELESEETRH
jgi:hypothetical protein